MDEIEGAHTHEPEAPIIVPPVQEANHELVAPVVDHAEKITRLEEHQARQEEEYGRQLIELEGRLSTATGSQVSALEEKIAALEAKIEASAAAPVEAVPDAVDFSVPDVEPSPAPPEKIRQGMRHRRKARKDKK